MHTLRLSAAAALAVSSLLSVAWAFSSAACGEAYIWDCASPTGVNLGTANNGDPTYGACPCSCCLNGPVNGHPYPQGDCPFADAGADGGPLACTGKCWYEPPHDWTTPLLLWFGSEDQAPWCPDAGPAAVPFVIFDGYGDGGFAFACSGGASGSCSVAGEVCGPAYRDGFSQCVVRDGIAPCPIGTPYTESHVFYETAEPQTLPSTFCCFSAPTSAPSK